MSGPVLTAFEILLENWQIMQIWTQLEFKPENLKLKKLVIEHVVKILGTFFVFQQLSKNFEQI